MQRYYRRGATARQPEVEKSDGYTSLTGVNSKTSVLWFACQLITNSALVPPKTEAP
jgi:hypothetical protein